MVENFAQLNPVIQALIGTLFTWGVTALGAATVFLTKTVNRKLLVLMLGFAAGVMIAASFWSLLAPAIEMSEELGGIPWLPAVIGFLSGGFFLGNSIKYCHISTWVFQWRIQKELKPTGSAAYY